MGQFSSNFFWNPTHPKPRVTRVTDQPIVRYLLGYTVYMTPLASFGDLTWICWCFIFKNLFLLTIFFQFYPYMFGFLRIGNFLTFFYSV